MNNGQSQKLELFFRAKDLNDLDTMSKSDPYCVLLVSDANKGNGAVLGKTETIKNDLAPSFLKSITVDFFFESQQFFKVKMNDDDGSGVAGDESLGEATFQLAHVVGSRNSTLEVPMSGKGKLFVTAKEASQAGNDTVVIHFHGHHLKKMDTFGKSDPYFQLFRTLPNGQQRKLFQSAVIDKTLDPHWLPCPAWRIADLTTGDFAEPTLRFECFDKDFSSDDSMGGFSCSFNDLMAHRNSGESLFLKDAGGALFGEIKVHACNITVKPSFVTLLRQGLQVNLAVSLDFTGSNLEAKRPDSLHYMGGHQPNQYVRAFTSVGDVLMEYDSDKQIPAFGFGAQLPDGQTSHFFNLNFQQNPHVLGVQGIHGAYVNSIQQVKLYGPTNFAPTITAVTQSARSQPHSYTILLIITDGVITDMQHTINAICAAADAPLSIIIVGVGAADFSMMDQLDGDDGAIKDSAGRLCRRDLVQFVPFGKFMQAPQAMLAAEVLREVPVQVAKWAELVNYKPPQ
jgi:hypothetical protein